MGELQIFDCEQCSPEWYEARLGIPTASMFSTVLAKGRGGKSDSVGRRTYLRKLAGEIITGEPAESYTNRHMERGHDLEDEARQLYAFANDVDPQIVGFIRNGQTGCSPDSLLGDDAMLEIKTAFPHILIGALERKPGDPPPEHRAQIQGQMWVGERAWCDLCIYWPKMPLYTCRVHRDEAYLKTLAEAVDKFNAELAELVERIRAYGQ